MFDELDPPGGGLARLRLRIEGEAARRTRALRRRAVAATALLLAVVGWTSLSRQDGPSPLPAEFLLARIGLGLVEAPSEPLTIVGELRQRLAAERVPLNTEKVVFYRVASIGDAPRRSIQAP